MTAESGKATTTEAEDMAGTAIERSNLYGFLATIFRAEVTPALLEKIGGIGFSATSQPVPGSMPSVANLAGFYFARRRQMIEETDALFDEMIRQSRIPFHARQDQRIDLDEWVEDLGPRYFLLGMLVPALNLAIDSSDRMQCRINGTRLMIAVEGYRARQGHLPLSLDDLVPQWLTSIPPDPFSPSGFVYRTSEGPGGYLLYSVGDDGKDDGGTVEPDGTGPDFVFNVPAR